MGSVTGVWEGSGTFALTGVFIVARTSSLGGTFAGSFAGDRTGSCVGGGFVTLTDFVLSTGFLLLGTLGFFLCLPNTSSVE